jgi:hypothetical protein
MQAKNLLIACGSLLLLACVAMDANGQGAEKTSKPRDKIGVIIIPAKPKEGTDVKPSYPANDVMLPAIRDLIFSPTINGATVTFSARPGPIPLVEIDKNPPVTDSVKHATFNPSGLRFSPVVMQNKSTPKDTAYAGGSYQTQIKLEQGTLYHYIVTLPAHKSYSEYQLTGSFRTLSRNVRVTFTRIKILDDSDSDSNGDLFFVFEANPAEPSQVGILLGNENATLDWESGHIQQLRGRLSLVIKNAPDRLRLLITGTDDDATGVFGCLLSPSSNEDPLWFEHLTPKRISLASTCDKEVNYARGVFDLAQYPGRHINIPFTITSLPLDRHGVTLAFDVSGYIEFTNPDIP